MALAVLSGGQEPGRTVSRQFVQGGQGLDRLTLEALLILHIGVEEPVVAVRVRHQVGRHDPMDPLHDEERHTDGIGSRLQPEHLRHGDLGVIGHHLHGLELTLHVVDHEDRVRRRVGSDTGDQFTWRGVFGHREIEEHGLRRHSVGCGHDEGGDGCPGYPLTQPLLELCAQLVVVARRCLRTIRVRWVPYGHGASVCLKWSSRPQGAPARTA
jgi:hypothetical protein